EAAIASYSQVIELNPTIAAAFDLRGYIRQEKGELEAALADYNQAIDLDPDLMTAYFHRGSANYYRKDWDSAVADFTQALRLHSGPNAGRQRGMLPADQVVFIAAGESDQQTITACLARAYAQRGIVRLRQKKEVEAEQDLARSLDLDKSLSAWIELHVKEVK